jgi:sugar/nucleoside kinase (ribokinase family)
MNKIILIGQAVIDYMYIGSPCFLERFDLRQNEKHKLDFKTIEVILSAIKPQYKDIGGCVTNTAIGLHNLGRDCSLVLSVGNDAFGFFFLEQLKKYFRIRPIPSAAEGITGVVLTFLEYNDNQ